MAEDPAIRALFGVPPTDIDLTASDVSINNRAVIAMLCLAGGAVILRFTARIVLRNALMADDWAIIAALCCIGATTGLSVAGGNSGSGKHVWSIKLEELMQLYKLLYAYTFIYGTSCTCTRVSILFFYQRVFSPLEPWLKVAMSFSWCLVISYPIIIWGTMAGACRPVAYFWTQFSGAKGTCIDINRFFLALGILNMLNDFIVLTIPFPRIIKLQMTLRKKLAICGILAVGIFVCVASILRIHYLSLFMGTLDVTWLMGPVFIWSTIEPSVAVVCACLPHLAPLVRLAHRSILSSLHSQAYTTGTSSRLQRGLNRPGHDPQSSAVFRNRGPSFNYGLEKMKKDTHDDEIGLTNYITVGPQGDKHPSRESVSEDYDHSIAVQSAFEQSSSPINHQRGG